MLSMEQIATVGSKRGRRVYYQAFWQIHKDTEEFMRILKALRQHLQETPGQTVEQLSDVLGRENRKQFRYMRAVLTNSSAFVRTGNLWYTVADWDPNSLHPVTVTAMRGFAAQGWDVYALYPKVSPVIIDQAIEGVEPGPVAVYVNDHTVWQNLALAVVTQARRAAIKPTQHDRLLASTSASDMAWAWFASEDFEVWTEVLDADPVLAREKLQKAMDKAQQGAR